MVGGVVSSVFGGGAKSAARAQEGSSLQAAQLSKEATEVAIAEQRRQFDLTREDTGPYREIGTNALRELGFLYGQGEEGRASQAEIDEAYERFIETPSYKFRFDEGVRARDRSAAARGRLRGGGYARELERYGQNVASQEFNTYADRLAALSGIGQSGVATSAAAGQNAANQIGQASLAGARQQGNALQNAGLARASGIVGARNEWLDGIGQIAGLAGAFLPG